MSNTHSLLAKRLDDIVKLNLVVKMNVEGYSVSYLAKGRFQYEDLHLSLSLSRLPTTKETINVHSYWTLFKLGEGMINKPAVVFAMPRSYTSTGTKQRQTKQAQRNTEMRHSKHSHFSPSRDSLCLRKLKKTRDNSSIKRRKKNGSKIETLF